jgi:hypothetical protein
MTRGAWALVAGSPKAGTDTTAKLVNLLPLLGGYCWVLLGTAAETLLYCYRQTPINFQRGQLGLPLSCYFVTGTSFLLLLSWNVCR